MSTAEISRHYNVCMMTANRALDILADESLIVRIKGSGSYVNKDMSKNKPMTFGLADRTSGQKDQAHKTLLDVFPETAAAAFQQANCSYRILPYEGFCRHDQTMLEGLDGILLNPGFIDHQTQEFITDCKIPIVLYRNDWEVPLPLSQVIPDHNTALDQLFAIIVRENIPGIVIFHHEHPNGLSRLEAFRQAARKANYDQDKIIAVEIKTHKNALEEAAATADKIPGKLVVTCSALIIADLVNVFEENYLECGKDYLFVSYDNIPHSLQATPHLPPVTTIDYSRSTAAKMAVMLLINLAKKKNNIFYQTVKFPTRLTIRESAFYKYKDKED